MNYTVALAGNPNCGKTTLFNYLTGSKQHVGNWPGVTVEKKVGTMRHGEHTFQIVDLPGIYSLSPYSMEERVARDFILDSHPDVVLNIVDGTNIERNLYLTLQLLELGVPVVVAVNMIDEIEQKGESIDCAGLTRKLGVPVLPISAKNASGVKRLVAGLLGLSDNQKAAHIDYDPVTRGALDEILALMEQGHPRDKDHREFYATRLLEGDNEMTGRCGLCGETLAACEEVARRYETTSRYGDRETMLADARYCTIGRLTQRYVVKDRTVGKLSVSEKIDRVVTQKYLAIPLFLLVMLLMFAVTFGPVGEFFKGGMEMLLHRWLVPGVTMLLESADAPAWVFGLFVEGILAGVGGVLSFLPQIMLLFFFLSVMEDSGYMARAAFIMDRLLRKIGLSGKSFIPMLMGFGCTVPAIMAARTMENEKDRRLTIMLTPFMSCGARLPIYALFASVFFPQNTGLVIFSIYLLGILVAILCGFLLKNTLFREGASTFIMELPPYRLPSARNTLLHMWDKCKGFLVKAGTLIFAMSVIAWLCQNFDFTFHMVADSSQSIFGKIGSVLAPLLVPLGFGTWQAAVALLSGFVAKEAVVSSMLVLYGAANTTALSAVIAAQFNPASAYAFMAFTLLYMPCVAAFGAMKKELGSWKWTVGTVLFQTGVAYLVAFLIFSFGTFLL